MGLWKSPDPGRRGHSPQMPPPGQRSGSSWVVLPWSLISTKHRECGWRGHHAVGELEGEPWPLPFRPCQRHDLPHLALSVSLAALATRDSAGQPSLPFTWKGHLPHLYHLSGTCLSGSQITFHSQKTILILKRVSTLWGKKVRWKNVVRERASWDWGTGNRYVLPPLPPTHTHTCQLGSLSICCVGFWSLSCPLFGGGCGG